MADWKTEIDDILSGFIPEPNRHARQQHNDSLPPIPALPEAAALPARMRELDAPAIQRFARLIALIERPEFHLPEGGEHEAQLFAAMNFAAWYLHQAWKGEERALSVATARAYAFVLMVGFELGRLDQTNGASS